VETARTPGQGGAGLGLAIVQTCVLACGGSVTAKNLDEGLEVKITLPVALADAVPAGAAT
jgi:signal transduction histidine kinase